MIAHEQIRYSRDGRPLAVPTQDCIWNPNSREAASFRIRRRRHPSRSRNRSPGGWKNKDPNISAKYEPNQTALYA